MKTIRVLSVAAAVLILAACVTINIYFPAAEAREAAEKIVDDIMGPDANKPAPPKQDQSKDNQSQRFIPQERFYAVHLLDLFIPMAEAAAQPVFDADSPAIRKLQAAMKQRYAALKPFFQNGAIGFTQDALVGVRDISAVPLKQRGQLKNLLAAENNDRNQLYQEIARVNGHPEWEKDVRETFSKTWISNAAKGWWYQNAQGSWVRK